jgi:hypothetical protein
MTYKIEIYSKLTFLFPQQQQQHNDINSITKPKLIVLKITVS